MRTVLGIRVHDDLVEQWREWFSPALQPFAATEGGKIVTASYEVRDTFNMTGAKSWRWFNEEDFSALSYGVRRVLLSHRPATGRLTRVTAEVRADAKQCAAGDRFPWWPTLLSKAGIKPVVDFIQTGVLPCQHEQLSSAELRATERKLPGLTDLIATFPTCSGPNCFGTVLACCGVSGTERQQMLQPEFERWLTDHCSVVRGTKYDAEPGLILVWRTERGLAAHTAVTIGHGWAFHKPTPCWYSPRMIWTVRDVISDSKQRGLKLSRHLIHN